MSDSDPGLEQLEDAEFLAVHLPRLEPRARRVLLASFAGETHRSIAVGEGVSHTTIGNLVNDALDQLRRAAGVN